MLNLIFKVMIINTNIQALKTSNILNESNKMLSVGHWLD